ncbi:MAG TPA: RNB domain-containing ribonuclease [Steroidobacteraceae bacterium]|jgi:exoribonuclease-2|nr:RNB domain-containing ribonuclease [Steroidobacteraceae bacterium]
MAPPIPSGRQILRRIARTAMLERGLLPEFSGAAMHETSALRDGAQLQSVSGGHSLAGEVRDLRHLLWCSIDNDDSRDLDQLSVAEPRSGGAVGVLVAIADVDALVHRGSAIDDHARHNTTSVYTAGRIFPMLPERLSTDLTSLGQGEERLALIVDMEVDGQGRVGEADLYHAMVLSRAKLAYDSVGAWLEGSAPIPPAAAAVPGMDAQLRIQDGVAAALRAQRHAHGALTLETIQTHAVFEEDALRDLLPDRKGRARELIEDLMIAANGATARFLEGRHFPSIRRVLNIPTRWDRIVALAKQAGESLPPIPDALALNTFLVRRRQIDPDGFADVSLAVVKSLGRGEYAAEPAGQRVSGHFSLAVSDYTHSTAPNRRFPDIITQRLVKAALAGRPPLYAGQELAELATHCTDQEDNAAKVERRVAKSAAALLLADRIGETFDALVTGAASKGTWVRIFHPAVEGKLTQGFAGADLGHRLRVRLVHVDIERGFIDFAKVRDSS